MTLGIQFLAFACESKFTLSGKRWDDHFLHVGREGSTLYLKSIIPRGKIMLSLGILEKKKKGFFKIFIQLVF